MGQKRKSGAAMLRKLRGQPNEVCQDLQEQNYVNREPENEDEPSPQSNGVNNSLMGRKHKSAGAAMLQKLRGQPNAVPQDFQEQNYGNREPENEEEPSPRSNADNPLIGRKHKSGESMLQKLREQPNAVPQDLQEQNYENREPDIEDASCPQVNGVNNSLMGRKHKSAGAAMLQNLRGQLNAVPQGLQEKNYDNREAETEDAPSPQFNADNSLMGRKHKNGAAMLHNLRGQPNAVPQDFQEQNYENREPDIESASCPQFDGDNNSLIGRKRKSAGAAMLQKLGGRLNVVTQGFQEQNYDNKEPETEDAPSPRANADNSLMSQKRKSGAAMQQKLREQPNAAPQDLQEQNYDSREPETEDAYSPLSNDDNSFASSSQTKAKQQKKCDPLLVKIMDIHTKETTIRKMTVNEVWDLEENLKVVVELNGNGQGDDNGTNLLVRFLGKLCKNPTLCPIIITSWLKMPKDKTSQQWKYIEDNFLFDYAAGCKWAMSNLGEKWRSHKYKLRCNYFYPNKTKQEVVDNPPPGVDSAHWTAFVEYYFDNDMKKKCHQNSLNREKLKVPHAGGSRSNARKSRQMAEKLGRPVCRGEVVLSNIVREDGSCVNKEGKKLAEEISKFLPQDQEHAATLDVSSMILASPYDAIGKVFGAEHSGRVRGLGVGVTPSNVFGLRGQLNLSKSSSFTSFVAEERIRDLVKQVDTLHEKLNGYDVIKECIGELVKQVGTLQEKLNGYDEMKTQLAQTQSELRETKAQLSQNQYQMGGLHKFLEDNFG